MDGWIDGWVREEKINWIYVQEMDFVGELLLLYECRILGIE